MNNYTSFNEIEKDLKRYKLERDIAFEELKLVKNQYKVHMQSFNWQKTALQFVGKYGAMAIIKRWLLKRN